MMQPATLSSKPSRPRSAANATTPVIVSGARDCCADEMPASQPKLDGACQQQRFERYVVPEFDFVRRVTRRFSRSAAEGDDLMQDVLTNAFRAAGRFDGKYPRAWLYRIASNAAASRARKHRDTTSLPEADRMDSAMWLASDESVEDAVIDPILDATLISALDELPEHYRSVIDLVDVGSLSYEDAARQLGVPTGTVMSRLHRGRRRLRDELAGTHLDRGRSGRSEAVPV
ncbi:MAG: RNA polymerase sigma factor [Actinobacteria bacterium]|nr:RNA polymerase sigma factor [Actinomycetota bacterium]